MKRVLNTKLRVTYTIVSHRNDCKDTILNALSQLVFLDKVDINRLPDSNLKSIMYTYTIEVQYSRRLAKMPLTCINLVLTNLHQNNILDHYQTKHTISGINDSIIYRFYRTFKDLFDVVLIK